MLWKYAAMLAAIGLVAPLPKSIGYFIGRVVADISFLLSKRSRANIIDNLRHVLGPDAPQSLVNHCALEVSRNSARNTFDLIQMPRLDPFSLEDKARVTGWEHMEEGLAAGKGVVLASVHMGNMDTSTQVIRARGVPLTILAEVEQPEQLYLLTRKLRSFNGISILPVTYSGIKEAMKRLRQNEVVAIACDRAIQGSGQRRKFFGQEALLPIGGVEMAYRTGAAILPAFTYRTGPDSFTMHFEPCIRLDRSQGKAAGIDSGVDEIVILMERYISQHPEQWMVFEPIWREPTSEPIKTASLTSGRMAPNGVGRRAGSANGWKSKVLNLSRRAADR